MTQLEQEGKLKTVQGYAQCGYCRSDLEAESVVTRIWKVDSNRDLDDGTLTTFDEKPGRKQ
jgi:hypothetical protein